MKRPRAYADTSVFGGCFDDEFADASRKFFAEVSAGKAILLVSNTTVRELEGAPQEVRRVLTELPGECVEAIEADEEVRSLRDAYLRAGVVGPASGDDAEHIACASVAGADFMVSWNFKHIVNFEKIRGYHAVNMIQGYMAIPIYSPLEVIEYEEETF